MQYMKKERLSNLELLRIVSIVLIIGMHSFTCVGDISSPSGETMSNLNHTILIFVNAVGNIGVTCFCLISGWFGIKWNLFKFLQIVWLTTLYHMLVFMVNSDFSFSAKEMIKIILGIFRYEDWFICCYLILMLLAPYFNDLINGLNKRSYTKLIILLIIFLSIIPTIFICNTTSVIPEGGKCLVYMVFLYFLGRYMRLYWNFNPPKKILVLLFFFCTMVIASLNYIVELIGGKNYAFYARDYSIFILISSISVFYIFKSFNIQSKFVNNIAKSVLGIYLLNKLYIFLDHHVFHLKAYVFSNLLIIYLGGQIVVTFVVTVVIDKMRVMLFDKIENGIIMKIVGIIDILKYNAVKISVMCTKKYIDTSKS